MLMSFLRTVLIISFRGALTLLREQVYNDFIEEAILINILNGC